MTIYFVTKTEEGEFGERIPVEFVETIDGKGGFRTKRVVENGVVRYETKAIDEKKAQYYLSRIGRRLPEKLRDAGVLTTAD